MNRIVCVCTGVWDSTKVLLVVYEVLLAVYKLTGGIIICQIYSPAFVWDDVTTIVYTIIIGHVTVELMWMLLKLCMSTYLCIYIYYRLEILHSFQYICSTFTSRLCAYVWVMHVFLRSMSNNHTAAWWYYMHAWEYAIVLYILDACGTNTSFVNLCS